MVTRGEIEDKLNSAGDYVKIDYLSRCLKQQLDFETRKFVLLRLAGIYETRGMFLEGGRLMRIAAEINTTFQGKITDFVKSMNLYIKAGEFADADISFNKAIACATENEKVRVKAARKEAYKTQAKIYLQKDKRKHASETYEKLLELDLDIMEKKEVQESLLNLYEKLGKVREYYNLKKGM